MLHLDNDTEAYYSEEYYYVLYIFEISNRTLPSDVRAEHLALQLRYQKQKKALIWDEVALHYSPCLFQVGKLDYKGRQRVAYNPNHEIHWNQLQTRNLDLVND